jgi:hypothetical protein
MFFCLRHFSFILHHLVLIVINTFSHIIICMFNEIIKKMIIILHSNQKIVYTPKNKKFKPKRKAIPSWRYFIKTMNWIILVQAIGRVSLRIIQCTCNTPFRVYYKSFGSIKYLEILGRVLHNHTKSYKEINTLFGVIYKHHGVLEWYCIT